MHVPADGKRHLLFMYLFNYGTNWWFIVKYGTFGGKEGFYQGKKRKEKMSKSFSKGSIVLFGKGGKAEVEV